MIHIGLFEGIGGFSLAASWMGWQTYLTCEINPFAQRVLKYYWPDAYHHGDIKTLTYETVNAELSRRYGNGWRNEPVIITGGFPCQPFSVAGKRRGTEDDRYLWPEMLRAIREIKPEYVVGENVPGLLSSGGGVVFEQVLADLEGEGYEVQPVILPAAGVNAPHRRDRLWIIAKNTNYCRCLHGEIKQEGADVWQQRNTGTGSCNGIYIPEGVASDTGLLGQEKCKQQTARVIECGGWEEFPTQPSVCGRNDGFPSELDGITFPKWRTESVKAYGNAIVPQVAYAIFKAIEMIS